VWLPIGYAEAFLFKSLKVPDAAVEAEPRPANAAICEPVCPAGILAMPRGIEKKIEGRKT